MSKLNEFPDNAGNEPISEQRLLLFKALTLAVPLLLLALLECSLRLFGYGHDTALFVEDPQHKDFLVMNQFASQKYFSVQQNATIGNFEPFAENKKPGTFRIFVLGESTTIGYPYMHNGSFHRWLQFRLMHTFPDRDFEVINLSLTAVNSYTVFDFAKELVDKQPDVVLVYTGHNEYYGASGVGSTSSFAHHPALMRVIFKLREFRLVQLIYAAMGKVTKLFSGTKIDLRENLMKRMAAGQEIEYHSDIYQAGIDQFQSNIDDLCQLLSERKIPVLISNLVSNKKDLKPFISSSKAGSEVSADAHYQTANTLFSKGSFSKARAEYILAKEYDLLRFRAPEAMNEVIRKAAGKYKGVTLVDTRNLFERHSEHGILGNSTLLEHVHPNLFGYALLSEAFYQAMKSSRLLAFNANEMSLAELRKRMPITSVDSLKGAYEMMILKEGWPFNIPMPAEEKRPKTTEEQLAGALVVKQISWREAMNQLQEYYLKGHDTAKTLSVTEALLLENPGDPALCDRAGKLCLALNKNRDAVTYLSKAFRLENSFDRAQYLFITLLKMDRPGEALPYLSYAAANNQSKFSLNELHSFVRQLVVVKNAFEKDSSNVTLCNQLAAGYLKFANTSAASKYIGKTLQIDPKNQIALQMEAQIRSFGK